MAYQVTYSTLPLAVPTTTQYDYSSYNQQSKYSYSISPPDAPGSTISAPSGYSVTTASSYAGSAVGDYESGSSTSSGSANGVDMQEYMQTRFENAFDPLPLDRTLAKQAQTSGLLNAKHREIMDLQALAQQRLAKSRARLAEGYQDAKEVKRDLEWTQKRVSAMKTKASRKHPKEYKQARQRYPSPEY